MASGAAKGWAAAKGRRPRRSSPGGEDELRQEVRGRCRRRAGGVRSAAADKKLAGAAKTSFVKKCEADAGGGTMAACEAQAADKKLAGAAKTSFTKKCAADAAAKNARAGARRRRAARQRRRAALKPPARRPALRSTRAPARPRGLASVRRSRNPMPHGASHKLAPWNPRRAGCPAPCSSTPTARCSTSTASASPPSGFSPAPASASASSGATSRSSTRGSSSMSGQAAQLSRLHPRGPALRRAAPRARPRRRRRARADARYERLAPFPENRAVLVALRERGVRAGILSNGDPDMLEAVVRHAGFAELLDPVLSVEGTGRFKTDPATYALGTAPSSCGADEVLFVSSNCWDAIGATWFGYTTLWVNRFGLPLDELGAARRASARSLPTCSILLRFPRTFPMTRTLPAGVAINAPILPGFETILTAARARARRQAAPRLRAAPPGAARRPAPSAPGASTPASAPTSSPQTAGDPRRRLEDRAGAAGAALPAGRDHRPGRRQDGHQRLQLGRRLVHDRLRGLELAVCGRTRSRARSTSARRSAARSRSSSRRRRERRRTS